MWLCHANHLFMKAIDPIDKQTHPACQTFANFYAALSYECLARAMHNYATNKIPTLELAEDYYITAMQSLASSNVFSDEHIPSATTSNSIFEVLAYHHQSRSPSEVKDQGDRPKSASSVSSSVGTASVDTTPSRPSSASSMCSIPYDTMKLAAKDTCRSARDAFAIQSMQGTITPPPLPPRLKSTSSRTVLPVTPTPKSEPAVISPTSPNSIDTWLLARSKSKYNVNLRSLRDQLEYHIRSVQALRTLAVKNQQVKRSSAAPASYWVLPTGTMSEEEKENRIQEGRARRWEKKSHFGEEKANKIRALCEQAMKELGELT